MRPHDDVLLRVPHFTDDGGYVLLVIEEKPTGDSVSNGRNNGKNFGRNRERQKL